MNLNYVTPFEVFKTLAEFYPKLGATIACGAMAAAARMIPTTSGGAIIDAPEAKRPALGSSANISSPRKRSTSHQSNPRKRATAQQKRGSAHKRQRKTSKRATGRRKAA
jgi:hypothetical protein